jgi:hypothetical protein
MVSQLAAGSYIFLGGYSCQKHLPGLNLPLHRSLSVSEFEHFFENINSTDSPSGEKMLHATLILFPDVSPEEAPDLIDRTKEELKPSFVQQGLMLGEFHRSNESPGLHNPNFRPLRSPIPMLAIRHMVSSDFVFLNRSEYSTATRLRYLEAYLAAPGIPKYSREEAERAVASLRSELQNYASPD